MGHFQVVRGGARSKPLHQAGSTNNNTHTNTSWALVAPVPVVGCTPPSKNMFYGPLCIIMISAPVMDNNGLGYLVVTRGLGARRRLHSTF